MKGLLSTWRSVLAFGFFCATLGTGCPGCEEPVTPGNFFEPIGFGEYVFDGQPELEAPDRLLFNDVPAGATATQMAEIKNIGREDLQIHGWEISDGFELSFLDSFRNPDKIGPGESVTAVITFTAPDDEEHRGTLLIRSNDEDEGEWEISLFANAKFPCLETIPDDAVDFGELLPGDTELREVEIRSCSTNAPTTFSILGVTGSAFAMEEPGLLRDVTLQPGESLNTLLSFSPPDAGDYSGAMEIVSDDEFRPEHSVALRGIGSLGRCPSPVIRAVAPDGDEVIAQPMATLDAIPLDRIKFDAGLSQAHDGKEIVEYRWSLVRKPQDSGAQLDETGNIDNNEMFLDLAGEYVVELDVVDTNGVTACTPARVTTRAIADEDIHIQLVWDTPNDPNQFDSSGSDVDLHLLHPQGEWNVKPYDCFWQNLIPDWATPRPNGVDSLDCERDSDRQGCHDDPSLDIDDVDGWGPENINLNNPQLNTRYAVGVHYFSDHGYSVSFATIRVFIGGILQAEYRQQRLVDQEFWYVADIDWPSGTVSPDGRVFPTFP